MMEISKQARTDHHHLSNDECNNPSLTMKEMEMEMEMEMVVVLAEDLILEILIRLPPISVFRFKFVCKSWYSLISNPDFLKKYHHQQNLLDHHHNSDDDILLLSTVEEEEEEEDKQHHHPTAEYVLLPQQTTQNQEQEQRKVFLDHAFSVFIPQKIKISSSSSSNSRLIDSCNGLLLYCNTNTISDETQYYVLNPITKQCFELPIVEYFGNYFREIYIYWIHIVFDPSVSLSFKVLMCFARRNLVDFGIYVYSSETSSWKYFFRIRELLLWDFLFDCHWKAVLLYGMLWLYTKKDKLVCFDVVKHRIWSLPLPPRAMEHHKRNLLYFGECGGRLRLIERYPSSNCYDHQIVTSPFSFDIMELEDVPDGHDHPKIRNWTVKFRVSIEMSYEDHIPLAAQIINIYKTGGVGKNKGEHDDETLVFLNIGRNTVVSYNLTSNTFVKERNISNSDHSLDRFLCEHRTMKKSS